MKKRAKVLKKDKLKYLFLKMAEILVAKSK